MDSDFQLGDWRVQPQSNSVVGDHRTFHLEPKMMGVLLCLAQRSGEVVSKEQIVHKVWEGTFVTDDVLVRCVSELRKVFSDSAGKPTVIETIPKRGYRLLIPAVPITQANGLESNVTAEFVDSIAVFPFENSGSDPEMEYLSDGVAETVMNNLSRLQSLRVVPRTTTFQFKGKLVDPARVGHELGARLVLNGHVTQRVQRLVVGVELIDAVRQARLWGQTYDRRAEDIFSIQDEIAAQILSHLRLRPSDVEKTELTRRPTENQEAYHLYLRAMYFGHKWSPEGIKKGFEYCKRAIEVDPAYAQAYNCLAYLYILVGVFGGALPSETFPKAKAAAIKALEIDDSSADAHTALSFVHLLYDWDWRSSELEARRAIQLGPSLQGGYHAYALWYLARGQFEEATAKLKKALSIDPLSVKLNYQLGTIYYRSRQYAKAIEQLQKTDELDPLFARTHHVLAAAYARKGMSEEAAREAERGLVLSGGSLRSKGLCGEVYALLGKQMESRQTLETLKPASGPPHYMEAYCCAAIHALLGERDEAFDWLNKAWQGRATALMYVKSDPNLENLHGDPRFDDLVHRMGLETLKSVLQKDINLNIIYKNS